MRALFALFGRSLREDVRARLPAILRATLVLVILLIVWVNERDFASHAAPGRDFLLMTFFANLGLLAIAAPGIFATAITEEKEDETLTLLRMTNLSPLAILFGKSTTRLIGALLLLAVQIPFTLLAVTLGGVSREQVLGAYAILGATTFFLCNLALLCSVVCRPGIRAGAWTVGIAGLLFVALPFFCFANTFNNMPGSLTPNTMWEHFGTWVIEANPVHALVMLIENQGTGALVATQVSMNLSVGLMCFLLSWLVFDRFCATEGESIAGGRRKSPADASTGKLRRSRPSIRRPLAWKDFHFLIGGWRALRIRSLVCGMLFFAAYAFVRWVENSPPSADYFLPNVSVTTMYVSACMFAFDLALVSSKIFGAERRGLTLGGLIGLSRTTGWLIRQKLLGCIPILIPSLALFGFGVWLRFQGESLFSVTGYDFSWLPELSTSEVIFLLYILANPLLLSLLIAALSLRIRRGALPASIAIFVAWKIFGVLILLHTSVAGSVEKFFLANGCLYVVIAIILAVRIHHGIPRAAAAD